MAYTKKTWVKGQTELSAENFNHMEQGIADAHSSITQLNSEKATVVGTLPSDTTITHHFDLPSGFTTTNCYIVAATINVDGYVGNVHNTGWVSLALMSNEIRYTIQDTGVFGKQIKIVLQKY